MSRNSSAPDRSIRATAALDARTVKVARSVENWGAVVRALGYLAMALGVALALLLLLSLAAPSDSLYSSGGSAVGAAILVALGGFIWGVPLVLVGGYAQMRSLALQAEKSQGSAARFAGSDPATPAFAPLAAFMPSHLRQRWT